MSKPSLTEQGKTRKALINAPYFEPENIGIGGPVETYVGEPCNTPAFNRNYDKIRWNKDK